MTRPIARRSGESFGAVLWLSTLVLKFLLIVFFAIYEKLEGGKKAEARPYDEFEDEGDEMSA